MNGVEYVIVVGFVIEVATGSESASEFGGAPEKAVDEALVDLAAES